MVKILKKAGSLLLALVMATNILFISASANFSPTPEYNPRLEEFGITEELFQDFPIEKKELYSSIVFAAPEDCTTEVDVKYFHVSPQSANSGMLSLNNLCDGNAFVEVTKEKYEAAINCINQQRCEELQDTVSPALLNPDSSSGRWYQFVTSVAYMGQLGGVDCYILSNSLYITVSGMDYTWGTGHDAYIAGGVNYLCSPISGSEIFTLTQTYSSGSQSPQTSLDDAPHKGRGYGFDFFLEVATESAEVSMSFLFQPLQEINLVDAYGFTGYWSIPVTGSVSIGIEGPSVSISPTRNLQVASDTHAQMYPA